MTKSQRGWIFVALMLAMVVGGVGWAVGGQWPVPLRLFVQYPSDVLVEEAATMNECAECHEAADFHTCQTCHDDHGAIEMENVPFYAGVTFTGDVPAPGYVLLDDIVPYRDQPHTYIPLLDFLAAQGVTDFVSVTMASNDGGFVTINRANVTPQAWLMPYEDGIRFASEDLHVSTWLKGITRFIVVGEATPLEIDGTSTSIGRLLTGPTIWVTVEQTDVMLKSETDGQIRKAKTAARVEGALVRDLVSPPDFGQVEVYDQSGVSHVFTADEVQDAVLALFQGRVTLILPSRGRSQWVFDVAKVQSYE